MNMLFTLLTIIAIYGLIGFLIFLVVKKINTKLKTRILLPSSDISIYLKPIDEIKEAKVKKEWLTIFILTYLSSFISIFFVWSNISSLQPNFFKITLLFIYGIIFSLSLWITYHCAYKKQGTAYLLLLLISIPLSIGFSLFSQLQQPLYWSQFSKLTLILLFINYGLNALFWIESFKLRRINLIRRYHQNALTLKEKFQHLDN